MKKVLFFFIVSLSHIIVFAQTGSGRFSEKPDTIGVHKVVLDGQSKIVSWIQPQSKAYDEMLKKRWDFIKTKVPNSPGPVPRSNYPIYYFYCDFKDSLGTIYPGAWMNDVGEKIPNWFEAARLYYAYSGDSSVMTIVKNLADYAMEHGTSPTDYWWSNFPYTTTNDGDIEYRGLTKIMALHEVQVDHAGDVGLTYYRLYQYYGEEKYKTAAIDIANTLASKVRTGTATQSPWPYRVVMTNGEITAEYCANWMGCYSLLDNLVKAGLGNVAMYTKACKKVQDFMLAFPMKTGFWTDGHSDTRVNSNTYKSNMSASNMALYLYDHPEFDPNWKTDLPMLIKWTEKNFVERCEQGEPAHQWGANIVGEQDNYYHKMDYQTARYAAQCARWYGVSKDKTYMEKAYRSFNWVTYANDDEGKVFEHPLSTGIISWWSDSYGECPRMFYQAFAAIPEWAPEKENHILYSEGVLKNVVYQDNKVEYDVTDNNGTEYIRLAFKPAKITVNGVKISLVTALNKEGYTLRDLGNGDYAVTIKRARTGRVIISGL